MQAEDRRYNV